MRVRSAQQIFDTLDNQGQLSGLPFMPEMLRFVGQTFRVQIRAESACASLEVTAIRRLHNTVHLEQLRCDGSAHGGCQSSCLLFWKEAWLEKTSPPDSVSSNPKQPGKTQSVASRTSTNYEHLLPVIENWTSHTSQQKDHYSCQATQLWEATEPMPIWSFSQYLRPILRNRISPFKVMRGIQRNLATKIIGVLKRKLLPQSTKKVTPEKRLHLQVGELVQVQPAKSIAATLDANGRNRGMWFDPQMYQYCGRTYRVSAKIERMIDEGTGRLIELQSPTVTLESIACDGCWHRFCSREALLFWREIWLQRVDAPVEIEVDSPPSRNRNLSRVAASVEEYVG